MVKSFSIGSFNVRGLSKEEKQAELAHDLEKYKLDVCSVQETKIPEGLDINVGSHRLICIEAKNKHHGNGFLVANKWKNSIHRYWKVSDRIAVLQLSANIKTTDKQLDNVKKQQNATPISAIKNNIIDTAKKIGIH